jgi:hypothetical protein
VQSDYETETFAYALASIPFFLAAVTLFIYCFEWKRADQRRRSRRRFSETLGVLAISALAALPTRAVSVPSDIHGITAVDLLLGTGIVAAAWWFVVISVATCISTR